MSEIIEQLNPKQKEAVTYLEKPLFVFAGPGTGKTRVTTHKLAYLIKEKGYKPDEILALTFTEKAAEEMKERVEELIPGTTGINISTFHSFCNDVIGQNSLELGINTGKTVVTDAYQQSFLLGQLDTLGLEMFKVPRVPIDLAKSIQGGISRFKQENITLEKLEEFLDTCEDTDANAYLKDLAKAYQAYEDFKNEKGLIDFGDMQLYTLRLFDNRPDIVKLYLEKIKYVIVDEFQDTDFIQLKILFHIAPEGNITIVGDDDQSIYRFRGAYLTNVQEFHSFYNSKNMEPKHVVLESNYRCSGNIQKVASNLIKNNADREEKEIKTIKDDQDPVKILKFQDNWNQAIGIVNTIEEMNENGTAWDDVAVLFRRRVDALPIIEIMEKRQIPFEVIGSREYFNLPIIRAVVSYLKFFADPKRNQPALGHILLRPIHGIHPGEIKDLARFARDRKCSLWQAIQEIEKFPGDSKHYFRFRKEMNRLFDIMGDKGIQNLVRSILFSRDFFKIEIEKEDDDNIHLLTKFLNLTYDYFVIYPDANLNDFLVHLDAMRSLGLEDDRKEPSVGKVHLMTIHGAKGKEFPVVFVPCLNKNRLPSRYMPYKINVPDELTGGILSEEKPDDLHYQEERRLCYVALTRAKDLLYLSYCDRYLPNKGTTPVSRYLTEIMDEKEGFEHIEMELLEDDSSKATDDIGAAVRDMIISSVERKDWQSAIEALTARIIHEGHDVKNLAIPKDLNFDDYKKKLNILRSQPEIEHAERAKYSPSALKMYDDCPLKYYHSYVLGIPGEIKPAFELGTIVHKVVENITWKIQRDEEVSEEKALKYLDSIWVSSAYESEEMEKQDRKDAEEWIRLFIARQAEKEGNIIGIEKWLELDIDGRMIRGKVDRIDDLGESIEVIDYKTSKQKASKPGLKKDFQMALYWLGLEKMQDKPISSIGHWYLRHDKLVMVIITPEELENVRERAIKIIESIEEKNYKASPGYQTCRFCDYADLCDDRWK